jgi:hypothetical protein
VSYLVVPAANFNVIGGVRTYTLSPKLNFTGTGPLPATIDVSKTAASAFGGFTYRPKLSDKWTLLSVTQCGPIFSLAFHWKEK